MAVPYSLQHVRPYPSFFVRLLATLCGLSLVVAQSDSVCSNPLVTLNLTSPPLFGSSLSPLNYTAGQTLPIKWTYAYDPANQAYNQTSLSFNVTLIYRNDSQHEVSLESATVPGDISQESYHYDFLIPSSGILDGVNITGQPSSDDPPLYIGIAELFSAQCQTGAVLAGGSIITSEHFSILEAGSGVSNSSETNTTGTATPSGKTSGASGASGSNTLLTFGMAAAGIFMFA